MKLFQLNNIMLIFELINRKKIFTDLEIIL